MDSEESASGAKAEPTKGNLVGEKDDESFKFRALSANAVICRYLSTPVILISE
jgi:hypothetical protein